MQFLKIAILAAILSACTSTRFDDGRNESLALKSIRQANTALKKSHINVTSFEGVLLITGQVPSRELIQIATDQVSDLRNVRQVHNELNVAGPTSLISRTNDTWLTTKVKSAMTTSEDTDSGRIKVVTENGVVYLLGRLTRAEADYAVEVARGVVGVQKIVKVFDYIN